jgi:hypothetical protein
MWPLRQRGPAARDHRTSADVVRRAAEVMRQALDSARTSPSTYDPTQTRRPVSSGDACYEPLRASRRQSPPRSPLAVALLEEIDVALDALASSRTRGRASVSRPPVRVALEEQLDRRDLLDQRRGGTPSGSGRVRAYPSPAMCLDRARAHDMVAVDVSGVREAQLLLADGSTCLAP